MEKNEERDLALAFILHTKRHIFLTGRAGSGKTTLVKEVLEKADKNCLVVAPTGVAAINVGGVTIHSFFQLPTTAFVPNEQAVDLDYFSNREALRKHMKFSKEKRAIMQALDLLIIDEISMVRPDLLDAVDYMLRIVRKNRQPFGDLQVLMVGDLYQLPPVMKNHEWEVLQEFYKGPYFFNATLWQHTKMIPIELKKIYRQSNPEFVNILNSIREGKVTAEDLEKLNTRHIEAYPNEEGTITLTTHNKAANDINGDKLDGLSGKKFKLRAEVDGKFSENNFPCAEQLVLKKGAQVMFIKNDKDKRYFNGRLAEVVAYNKEDKEIKVRCKDDDSSMWVQAVEWENVTYSLDEKTEKIEKEKIGSFKQFPFRLAWAVTVHKSQGLTLQEVVLDLSRSFAAGQTYVGLSRCVALEGIVLTKPLRRGNIIIDQRITSFYKFFPETKVIAEKLPAAKKEYALFQLQKAFTVQGIALQWEDWNEYIYSTKLPQHDKVLRLAMDLQEQINGLEGTAKIFNQHLVIWISEALDHPEKIDFIRERAEKAIPYFVNILYEKCIMPLHDHLRVYQNKAKVKKYLGLTSALYKTCWRRLEKLYALKLDDKALFVGDSKWTQEHLGPWQTKGTSPAKKGGTFEVTLALFKEDMTIDEIAKERGLTVSTVHNHLTKWLKAGDITLDQIIGHERIEELTELLQNKSFDRMAELRGELEVEVSYDELRWMKFYLKNKRDDDF